MTRLTASRHSIDALSLKLNAGVWLIAALLATFTEDGTFITAPCYLLAILNLCGLILCQTRDRYISRGRSFSAILRSIQGIFLSASCYFPMVRLDLFWLLGIPILLADAMVEGSLYRCVALSVAMGGSFCVFSETQGGSFSEGALPLAIYLMVSLMGAILTRYRGRQELLIARARRMNTLVTTAQALSAKDLNGTITRALESVVGELGASAGIVALRGVDDEWSLNPAAQASNIPGTPFSLAFEVGKGLTGQAVARCSPMLVESKCGQSKLCEEIPIPATVAVSVPLPSRGRESYARSGEDHSLGALTIAFTHDGDTVDAEDLALLQSVGSLLGAAVSNRRMEIRQRQTFMRTLESLATALEARDDYTRGHSHRVCELSLLIGQELGMSTEALEDLRTGTTLHDIGKIGVPDAILNKPGRLTVSEFRVMRLHPVIGYDICKPLRLPEMALKIIRNHHEKLDGAGYPDGLSAIDMPLELRVVCVADAFDAMSSRRAYRSVMDIKLVMREMNRCAGTQFDADVLGVLWTLYGRGALHALYSSFWEERMRQVA